MPTIICSYCEYVGQGEGFGERIQDVLEHEEICPDNVDRDEDMAHIDDGDCVDGSDCI